MTGKPNDRDSGSPGGGKVASGQTVHGADHMAAQSAGFVIQSSGWLKIANRGLRKCSTSRPQHIGPRTQVWPSEGSIFQSW